jgi:hypothetical protein
MKLHKKMKLHSCLLASFLLVLAGFPAQGRDGQIPFTYTLQEAGQVSAVVSDSEGRILRTLLRGEKQDAGEHTIHWDGLDRYGKPHQGQAIIKVLRTPGFQAEYVTCIGTNPDSASYHRWPGEHRGPSSVAVDESKMFVASEFTETAPILVAQSRDGTQRFWDAGKPDIPGGWVGIESIAVDGKGVLYVLQANGYLTPFDATTGEPLAARKAGNRAGWDPLPALPEGQRRTHQLYRHTMPDTGSVNGLAGADIAAGGETLVISFDAHDSVRWLSRQDGSAEQEVEVPSPLGIAVGPEEQVYVISEGRVLQVQPSGKKKVVLEHNLTAPRRLDVDPDTGDFLVAEGRGDWRIKRFGAAGRLRQTYGRKGGRENGPYRPEDFFGLTDITADGDGGFLTVENYGPRRVAHFDRDGKLLNEWFGGLEWAPRVEPDPEDPSSVWYFTPGWLIRAQIDYEKGEWRVAETHHVNAMAGGLGHTYKPGQGPIRVCYHKGRRYLVTTGSHPQVFLHQDATLKPVVVMGRYKHRGAGKLLGRLRNTAYTENNYTWERMVELAGRGAEESAFQWIDENHNGQPEPEEFGFDAVPVAGAVAPDMSLISFRANYPNSEEKPFVGITRCAPVWQDGVPRYDWNAAEVVVRAPRHECMWGSALSGAPRGAWQDFEGNYYVYYCGALRDAHPTYWPAKNFGKVRFARWDRHGNLLWQTGRAAAYGKPNVLETVLRVGAEKAGLPSSPSARPTGQFQQPSGVAGETENAIVMGDRLGTHHKVWTKDGLYAGQLFDRRVDDGLPDRIYAWHYDVPGRRGGSSSLLDMDNVHGARIFQRDDGTLLYYAPGRNNVPVYKIHGWDGWERYETVVSVDAPPHAAGEGRGLRAAYYGDTDFSGIPVATRIEEQVWHGMAGTNWRKGGLIDGGRGGPLFDFSDPRTLTFDETAVSPAIDMQQGFAVRWTGRVEAPLSEPFRFVTYQRGRVRLWLDGQLVIDAWDEAREIEETKPIQLQAGERVSVRLEFNTESVKKAPPAPRGGPVNLDFYRDKNKPACSLLWESPTLERERIPTGFLYPAR